MIRAAGILGSDSAAKKLHAGLRSRGVELERRNFRYIDELLELLYINPSIEAVIIYERGIKAEHPDFHQALETIRNADISVRILFIMDLPERDYDFEVWCYERGIYDVFYPGRHSDVNIDLIGATIAMGRIDPDVLPPPPTDPNAQPEPDDKPGLMERIKGISLPEFKLPKLPDFKLPSFSEFMRKKQKDEPLEAAVDSPQIYRKIGVINSTRGLGATTLVVRMAEYLHNAGYSVAVMALDLKDDLQHSGLAEKGVTVSIPVGDEMDCWVKLAEAHDFLIIDFGVIFEFLPSGAFTPAAQRAAEARAVQDARDFCDINLYLISGEPWHINKKLAFSKEVKGFTVNVKEADASTILHTMGVLPK